MPTDNRALPKMTPIGPAARYCICDRTCWACFLTFSGKST
jgi:hypothetical protein